MKTLSNLEFFPLVKSVDLAALPIADLCSPKSDVSILGIGRLGIPKLGYLTFCDKSVFAAAANAECRSIILASNAHAKCILAAYPCSTILIVEDPRAVFLDAIRFLLDSHLVCQSSLLPAELLVSADAQVSERAYVETGVRIDEGVTVASGAIVRTGTWLQANVSVGENCVIGAQGIYAYLGRDGARREFPHLASVIVEQGASLGASCVIPRGMLNSTRIGPKSIVGNLCNIGHGVEIGSNVWISSSTAIGGQTKIGTGSTIALGSVIRDNVDIGDCANIGMGSVVTKNVRAGQSVFGNPARSVNAINIGPKR